MVVRRVPLRAHAELDPVSDEDVLMTAGIGPHGEAVALWSTTRPRAARLTRHFPGRDAVVELDDLALGQCLVQPLPDDRFLAVGRRSRSRTNANAQVIDSAGDVVAEEAFGDGIGHIATTPSGQVWVGYFDEGIFGGSDPVGARGLLRFDEKLARVWEYPDDTGFGPVCDCYALNVDDEVVWASYYVDFPVVRIADDRVTGWVDTPFMVSALITDGWRCALVGGDGGIVLGELTHDGRFESRGEARLRLPDGDPLDRFTMAGRGDVLHVIADGAYHKLDLDQLHA